MEGSEHDNDINQTTLAVDVKIKDNSKHIGAGFINNDKRLIHLVEFEDNDHFSNLENLIIQLNDETKGETKFQIYINLPKDESYKHRLIDIINQCDVNFTVVEKKDFNPKGAEQLLETLLSNPLSFYTEELTKEFALGAARCAIDYTQLSSKSENHGKYRIEPYSMSNYLRLDLAAMNSLNIFPQSENFSSLNSGYEITSIFEILRKAKTQSGLRLIRRWLKQPIRNESEINRRLDIVEFFVNEEDVRVTIQNDHLRSFPDLDKLHVKFYKVHNHLPCHATLED